MFGRQPRLPVDLVFGLSTLNGPCEYSEYVCLSQTNAQANQTSRIAKARQKKHCDKKTKGQDFRPGDRVLIQVCLVRGWQKLGDKWESRPYIVLKKTPSTPVYVGERAL